MLRLSVILLVPALFAAVFSQSANIILDSDFDITTTNLPTDNTGNMLFTVSTPTWLQGSTQCLFQPGSCFDFTVSDYMEIDSQGILPPNEVTVEAWINPRAFGPNQIIMNHHWQNVPGSYILFTDASGAINFGVYDGASSFTSTGPVLTPNQWSHVVGTYDGLTVKAFTNGVKGNNVVTPTQIPLDVTAITYEVGAVPGAANSHDGLFDGIRIHDVALSDSDVAAAFGSSDFDNDGISNADEDIDGDGNPENDDSDSDGVANYLDSDDDHDGIPATTEGTQDEDNDGLPNFADPDSDGDGVHDSVEGTDTYLDADADSLAVEITFDDDTADDSSGYENHGTITGDGSFSTVTVVPGKSYSFNGGDYIDVANKNLINLEGTTIEFWFNSNNLTDRNIMFYAGNNGDGYGGQNEMYLIQSENGQLNFQHYYGASLVTFDLTNGASLDVNEWHHVAMVVESDRARLYLNGDIVDSDEHGLDIDMSAWDDWVRFGRHNGPSQVGRAHSGLMDEIKIYNRALTSEEIGDEYLTGDLDNDGLTNREEKIWGTDLRNPDTDNDGTSDGDEIDNGTNPLVNAICSAATLNINVPPNFHQSTEMNVTSSNTLSGTVNYKWTTTGSPVAHATDKPSINLTYAQLGKYNLTLEINNGSISTPEAGTCPLETTATIDVTCPASVSITPPEYPRYPIDTSIVFEGVGTHIAGETVTLGWDTNDDGVVDVTGSPLNISYPQTGKYNVTLIGSGFTQLCTAQETYEITIDDGAPYVTLTSPGSGDVMIGEKLLFSFEAFDLDGEIVEWIWDFGERNLPWGSLSTSGNQPACFSNTNQAQFCVGANEIEWASDKFEEGADCTCLDEEEDIYPQSTLTFDEDPGVLIHSYASSDVCDDYGENDGECEVSITVIDDDDLSTTATITLDLEEDKDFMCEDFIDNTVSCSEGSSNLVLSSGDNHCCCELGLVSSNVTLVDQTTGEQAVECVIPDEDVTDGVVETTVTDGNPVVPSQPSQFASPDSNVVTNQASQVNYGGQSIITQTTGRTEPEDRGLGLGFLLLVIIILIAAVVTGVFFVHRKSMVHKSLGGSGLPPSAGKPQLPTGYVRDARSQGMSDSQIRSNLKAKGWSEAQIKGAMRKP